MPVRETLEILRARLGPDPIAVLARRLRRDPDEVFALVAHDLPRLLDLTEDPDLVDAILDCLAAGADRR